MSLGDDLAAPYSWDLRDRVTAAVAAEASARSAAGRFGVSVSSAIGWAWRWRPKVILVSNFFNQAGYST